MIKKIVMGIILSVGILGGQLAGISQASGDYWEDNKNYPIVGVRTGVTFFIDLSSCTFVRNDATSYEFACICYKAFYNVTNKRYETSNKTIYIRQLKDGHSAPEYSWDNISWNRMRYITDEYESELFLNRNYSWADLYNNYNIIESKIFRAMYKQLWYVEYGG